MVVIFLNQMVVFSESEEVCIPIERDKNRNIFYYSSFPSIDDDSLQSDAGDNHQGRGVHLQAK